MKSFGDYKGILPYASELFGIYQPLLGWKSRISAAVPGAVAATAAVFTIPVVLASFTAQLVAKLKDARWFQAFGRFAVAAAVGALRLTLLALARPVVDVHWALLLGSAVVFAVELRGVHPIILIAAAVLLGAAWPLINDGALAGF